MPHLAHIVARPAQKAPACGHPAPPWAPRCRSAVVAGSDFSRPNRSTASIRFANPNLNRAPIALDCSCRRESGDNRLTLRGKEPEALAPRSHRPCPFIKPHEELRSFHGRLLTLTAHAQRVGFKLIKGEVRAGSAGGKAIPRQRVQGSYSITAKAPPQSGPRAPDASGKAVTP